MTTHHTCVTARASRRFGVVDRMLILLSGAIAPILSAAVVQAQRSTELPPPPAVSFPEPMLSPAPATPSDFSIPPLQGPQLQGPQSAPSSVTPLPPTEREAAYRSSPNATVEPIESYQVYVNGSSPYLLQQVQLVAPAAVQQSYRGRAMIYVGRFGDAASARQQIAALQAQGIRAELVREVDARSTPEFSGNRYLVVVPGKSTELGTLANQAVQLGAQPEAIQQREAPLEPHVAIGPYRDRDQAESLSRHLRRNGMDARVIYRR